MRVITALRKLVPISAVIICEPARSRHAGAPTRDSETLRQRLIAAYGAVTTAGERIAMCAYCGTTRGQIEIDHRYPQSRGGTDAWSNLVLACATCNARKGNRTPEEAGMSLRVPVHAAPAVPARARPYARQTARLVTAQLQTVELPVVWQSSSHDDSADLSPAMNQALTDFASNPWPHRCSFVAKPIARPRKQVFSARNYPLATPARGAFTRIHQTVKRRIQVNRGLARWRDGNRPVARVIRVTEPLPDHAAQIIRLGMLCEGQRAGRVTTGIVRAIHADNRLTLLVPESVEAQRVVWQRTVVGVQRHLRVLSSDGVIFLRVPDSPQEQQ
jgi:hypothetical protein